MQISTTSTRFFKRKWSVILVRKCIKWIFSILGQHYFGQKKLTIFVHFAIKLKLKSKFQDTISLEIAVIKTILFSVFNLVFSVIVKACSSKALAFWHRLQTSRWEPTNKYQKTAPTWERAVQRTDQLFHKRRSRNGLLFKRRRFLA